MTTTHLTMRAWRKDDAEPLWQLFYDSIHTVTAADYSPRQRDAWAPATYDPLKWQKRMEGISPWLCLRGQQIVGYYGFLECGYLDHFYVHAEVQRQGVGRRMLTHILHRCKKLGLDEITTDASLTATPFFLAHGFELVTPQVVEIRGERLQNNHLRRILSNKNSPTMIS